MFVAGLPLSQDGHKPKFAQRTARISHHAWISRHAGQVAMSPRSLFTWFLLCKGGVTAHIPNETSQLASYSGDDFRLRLACGRKPAIPL